MLVRPTYRQVLKVAQHMRELDWREMSALISKDPRDIAFEVSSYQTPSWAAVRPGRRIPAYVFGMYIQPHNDKWCMWGFGTDDFPKVALSVSKFILGAIPIVRRSRVDYIQVMSLAEKVDAHRWLEWLGWNRVAEINDYRHTGENFLLFEWR